MPDLATSLTTSLFIGKDGKLAERQVVAPDDVWNIEAAAELRVRLAAGESILGGGSDWRSRSLDSVLLRPD